MTVIVDQVLRDAGAGTDDADMAAEVLAEAVAYVDIYVTDNLIDATNPVPDAVNDAAVLVCATDLFARRKAPFGQQITTDANGTAQVTRLGSDPMANARPKLRPWCFTTGFAYPVDTTA